MSGRKLAAVVGGAALLCLCAGPAAAGSYYIWNDYGGSWCDADKTGPNTDDDLMCWAASSSNVLAWTGWGAVGGMSTCDEMFDHFQDHFTDEGGNPYFGWDWWFDGTNDVQGVSGWAQEDVDGGGGFWTAQDIDLYRRFSSDDAAAMATIDQWLHDGYGTTLSLSGPGAHSITCWGFSTDGAGAYSGVYVTDSDDYTDSLRNYSVAYSGGHWYLQNYGGSNGWYISEVVSLALSQVVPLPPAAAIGLLLLGGASLVRRVRRKR